VGRRGGWASDVGREGEAVYGWREWVGRGLRIRMAWSWEFYIAGLGLGVDMKADSHCVFSRSKTCIYYRQRDTESDPSQYFYSTILKQRHHERQLLYGIHKPTEPVGVCYATKRRKQNNNNTRFCNFAAFLPF